MTPAEPSKSQGLGPRGALGQTLGRRSTSMWRSPGLCRDTGVAREPHGVLVARGRANSAQYPAQPDLLGSRQLYLDLSRRMAHPVG